MDEKTVDAETQKRRLAARIARMNPEEVGELLASTSPQPGRIVDSPAPARPKELPAPAPQPEFHALGHTLRRVAAKYRVDDSTKARRIIARLQVIAKLPPGVGRDEQLREMLTLVVALPPNPELAYRVIELAAPLTRMPPEEMAALLASLRPAGDALPG